MHFAHATAARILSAALLIGFVSAQFVTSDGYTSGKTVYAQGLAPSPVPSPTASVRASPIATTTAQSASNPAATNPAPAASVSALQQVSDQIASVSQQVAQTVQDPSLSVEAKVQLINILAAQFNQLVAQWQQLFNQSPVTAPVAVAGVQATPTLPPVGAVPVAPAGTAAANAAVLTPTPTANPGGTGPVTADQLRAQIATVSQQMAQVSQDPTLTADARNAQLTALGTQFNQLTIQLQQLGG